MAKSQKSEGVAVTVTRVASGQRVVNTARFRVGLLRGMTADDYTILFSGASKGEAVMWYRRVCERSCRVTECWTLIGWRG